MTYERGLSIYFDGRRSVLTIPAGLTMDETLFFARNVSRRLNDEPTDELFEEFSDWVETQGIKLFEE